ncbi:hypothetical protein ABMA28_005780 [Loxostege sticticalis]|uniref:DUF7869 domain-containing protein n=1 Tax=Loxostege sticticalis TaxID=481309 RepID=A0ABD0SRW8_LOXSC
MPSTSKQDTTVRPNYRISPIHTDESDVDLSDSDPTFKINENKPLSSGSESSSDSPPRLESQNQNTDEPKKKMRKRVRNPSKWKQNIIKNLRNSGKAYVSLTKKQVPARSMKNPCTSKCRLKCAEKIAESDRVVLFNSYYKLGSLELQRAYIRSCLMEVMPKYKYTNAQKPRLPNNAFYFTVNEQRIRVCKQFYINTLDISDRQIRTVKAKTDSQGFLEQEKRGKHDNRKRINSDVLQDIKDHINSIPRIESHYLRSKTDKEYISDGKTIKDLCNDFNKQQRENNRTECDYWLYINTFNKDFNIGFYQPKKDRCETCLSYELAPLDKKNNLKTYYDNHLIEKDLCREEKMKDRENVDDNHVCAIYDLQSVMLCPSPSYFYYASKINCLDFTITQLNAKATSDNKSYGDVFCYFWDETQGNRGANEIGSCVFDYLKNINSSYPNGNVHVTFYSDNCTGQNKNKMIACLYSFAVVYFENIQSITHKYLIKGHTQNEADNVHSLIEKEIKKNERGGPIYAPCQYATIIKSARKSGNPFTVKELNYDFFLNLKQLQDQWGYNFNENVEKEKLNWTDIKILRFVKNELFFFQYKTSYLQTEFKTINMRNKRRKMLGADEIVLEKLYRQPFTLKENKKKDLKDLARKNLIPSFYAAFYNSL